MADGGSFKGYKQYLSTPTHKTPKVTAWRRRKRGLNFENDEDTALNQQTDNNPAFAESIHEIYQHERFVFGNQNADNTTDLVDDLFPLPNDSGEPALDAENQTETKEYYADDDPHEFEHETGQCHEQKIGLKVKRIVKRLRKDIGHQLRRMLYTDIYADI